MLALLLQAFLMRDRSSADDLSPGNVRPLHRVVRTPEVVVRHENTTNEGDDSDTQAGDEEWPNSVDVGLIFSFPFSTSRGPVTIIDSPLSTLVWFSLPHTYLVLAVRILAKSPRMSASGRPAFCMFGIIFICQVVLAIALPTAPPKRVQSDSWAMT